jgi:hypothetical protein
MLKSVMPYITDGPGSSVSFNPADQSITQIMGQRLGPIVCSAQWSPQCQFHWIKPDGTVVYGSKLEIPRLSRNDHGTFTCHTGNGYRNNATENLSVTANCKYLMLNTMLLLENKGNNKITELEQSYKGKVKTHNYINRQNQSTTGKLWKP